MKRKKNAYWKPDFLTKESLERVSKQPSNNCKYCYSPDTRKGSLGWTACRVIKEQLYGVWASQLYRAAKMRWQRDKSSPISFDLPSLFPWWWIEVEGPECFLQTPQFQTITTRPVFYEHLMWYEQWGLLTKWWPRKSHASFWELWIKFIRNNNCDKSNCWLTKPNALVASVVRLKVLSQANSQGCLFSPTWGVGLFVNGSPFWTRIAAFVSKLVWEHSRNNTDGVCKMCVLSKPTNHLFTSNLH